MTISFAEVIEVPNPLCRNVSCLLPPLRLKILALPSSQTDFLQDKLASGLKRAGIGQSNMPRATSLAQLRGKRGDLHVHWVPFWNARIHISLYAALISDIQRTEIIAYTTVRITLEREDRRYETP